VLPKITGNIGLQPNHWWSPTLEPVRGLSAIRRLTIKTLVLYRMRPHNERRVSEAARGQIRYSRLKEAARGKVIMQI